MPRVKIVKNCNLSIGHEVLSFKTDGTNCNDPGYYEVSDEVANHWFLRFHTDDPPEPQPPLPGTLADIRARAVRVNELQKQAEVEQHKSEQELEKTRQGNMRRVRRALGDDGTIERQLG